MDTCSDLFGRSTQPAVLAFFGTWRRIQTISFRSSLLASTVRVKPARRSIFIPLRSQTASLPTAPTKVWYSETLSKIPLKKGGKSLTTCYEYWMWICHWSCRQTWSRLLLHLQIIETCMPSTCCGKKKNVARAEFLPVLQREQNDDHNEINMWIPIMFQTEYALPRSLQSYNQSLN